MRSHGWSGWMGRAARLALVVWPVLVLGLSGCTPAGAGAATGQIAFTFDDGDSTVYTTAYPILASYGYRATLYVVTDWVGGQDRVTLDQLIELRDAGWCIGSHTRTHPHLPQLSAEASQAELAASRQWLEDNGLGAGSGHFAWPFGEYGQTSLEQARLVYDTAVTTREQLLVLPIIDPHLLPRRALGSPWGGFSVDKARMILRMVKEARGILLTYLHRIGPGGEWTGAEFQEIVAYAHELGLAVVTIQDIAEAYLD